MSDLSFEYAKALYELASKEKIEEAILSDLKYSSLIFMDEEILKFFIHPEIPLKNKKELINKDFKDGLFKDFLYVLLDNRRINIIDRIYKDYENIYLNEKLLTKVFVYSAKELSDNYKKELKNKLEKDINKKILIENIIDNSITAGIRIEYDSKQIDLTLNKKFDDLVSTLRGVDYGKDKR